jgi:hypothetical protein
MTWLLVVFANTRESQPLKSRNPGLQPPPFAEQTGPHETRQHLEMIQLIIAKVFRVSL